MSIVLFACQDTAEQQRANALIHETSPYLLQHAHNPVHWYPWSDQALEKARKEDKLLIISVGYAACHWCHVMEDESFEDSTVAAMMNQHFVSIKVDREERPDVDQVYMEAAQLANGRGGWPLNAIALPDGRPVFAGSYYPKEDWLRIIRQMAELYEKSPDRLELVAEQLTKGIRSENFLLSSSDTTTFSHADTRQYFSRWLNDLDLQKGGTIGAPKFPLTSKQHFLMRYYYHTANDTAYQALITSLDAMAMGGLYDQLGGGFARYATDEDWKVPHFEKMLYDNALLVSLYSDAYRLTGIPHYEKVVRETLQFMQREMYGPSGLFYASLDADSEGEEGKYYVWSAEEIDGLLGDDADLFKKIYNIKPEGNWEDGKNILYTTPALLAEASPDKIAYYQEVLFEARQKRKRPATDDKLITAWNAMAVKAWVDAYRAFGDDSMLEQALTTARLLDQQLTGPGGKVFRTYKDGKVKISGFLDDYALLIQAYTSVYQLTFDITWLEKARQLTDYVLKNFSDPESPLLYYTSDEQASLIARKKEVRDNVIPSSNALMAENLYVLGELYYQQEYLQRAEDMLAEVKASLLEYPDAYTYWALVMLHQVYPPYEVAIVGSKHQDRVREISKKYIPNVIFLGGEDDQGLPLLENKMVSGKTFIYVCQDKICKLPVTSVQEALMQISNTPG
jgi:uncharacterized protein YyaL (SSP411 family)